MFEGRLLTARQVGLVTAYMLNLARQHHPKVSLPTPSELAQILCDLENEGLIGPDGELMELGEAELPDGFLEGMELAKPYLMAGPGGPPPPGVPIEEIEEPSNR